MENNEGEESSKKLSPPRILPLTSLRISEGKGHLQLVIGSLSGHFSDSQQGLLAQDRNYYEGAFLPSQFVHTPALSSQTTKGVWYQELWVRRRPNKDRNAIYNMKYAKKK
jgi:hypothetical protein